MIKSKRFRLVRWKSSHRSCYRCGRSECFFGKPDRCTRCGLFPFLSYRKTVMLKPWPNAIPRNLKPTRVKLSTWSKLGIVWSPTWLELDRAFLHLIKLKFSPNSSQGVHHLATSKQVALLLLGDGAVVVSKLNGFLASWLDLTVPPARFDFVTWLELGAPFGQG